MDILKMYEKLRNVGADLHEHESLTTSSESEQDDNVTLTAAFSITLSAF